MSKNVTASFFREFSAHLDEHYSRAAPGSEQQKRIRNGPKYIRRLDSLSRLLIREQSADNCAAVALVNNKWYFTANDNCADIERNLDFIFKGLKRLKLTKKFGVISTKETRKYLLKKYLKEVKSKPKIYARLQKDLKKFCSALKTNAIYSQKEIKALLTKKYKFKTNPKGLHAEVRLLSYLARKCLAKTQILLGISKLCCKLCASSVKALETGYKLDIQMRGRHGNFYFAWTPSSLLLNNKCLKHFVGKEAYHIFKHADKKTTEVIISRLKNLNGNRDKLDKFFIPGRGAPYLNSTSAASPSTDNEASIDDHIDLVSEYPDSSDSEVE